MDDCVIGDAERVRAEINYRPNIFHAPKGARMGIDSQKIILISSTVKLFFTISYTYYEYIVTCIPIARQRVGKHVPATQALNNSRTSIAR
jgi:hypothetical protein